jgi:hypothetical protein
MQIAATHCSSLGRQLQTKILHQHAPENASIDLGHVRCSLLAASGQTITHPVPVGLATVGQVLSVMEDFCVRSGHEWQETEHHRHLAMCSGGNWRYAECEMAAAANHLQDDERSTHHTAKLEGLNKVLSPDFVLHPQMLEKVGIGESGMAVLSNCLSCNWCRLRKSIYMLEPLCTVGPQMHSPGNISAVGWNHMCLDIRHNFVDNHLNGTTCRHWLWS